MKKRIQISKKMRYEVFRRDAFKCQYCGRSAPDVVLEIDHINPVSKGGENGILNLVTACVDCNRGKGARKIEDDSIISKQREQLEDLNLKREQMKMMIEWRKELLEIEQLAFDHIKDFWAGSTGTSLNHDGEMEMKQWIKKYSWSEVVEALEISTNQYLKTEPGTDVFTHASVEKAFEYIGRICRSRAKDKEKPYLQKLYYIRGILRNRIGICVPEWLVLCWMEKALLSGKYTLDSLEDLAKSVNNWYTFQDHMEEFGNG